MVKNELFCWNKCENELACNSISFFIGDSTYLFHEEPNCFLYANKEPKAVQNENFVSRVRTTKSNSIINLI